MLSFVLSLFLEIRFPLLNFEILIDWNVYLDWLPVFNFFLKTLIHNGSKLADSFCNDFVVKLIDLSLFPTVFISL